MLKKFLLAGSLRAPAFPFTPVYLPHPAAQALEEVVAYGRSQQSLARQGDASGQSCSSVEQSSAQQQQLWVNSPALPTHFTSLRLSLLSVKIGQ